MTKKQVKSPLINSLSPSISTTTTTVKSLSFNHTANIHPSPCLSKDEQISPNSKNASPENPRKTIPFRTTTPNTPSSTAFTTPTKQMKKLAPFGGKIKSTPSSLTRRNPHHRNNHNHQHGRPKAKSLSPKPNHHRSNHTPTTSNCSSNTISNNNNHHHGQNHHYYPHPRHHSKHSNSSPKRNHQSYRPLHPAPMTVIINRVDVFDGYQANGCPSNHFNSNSNSSSSMPKKMMMDDGILSDHHRSNGNTSSSMIGTTQPSPWISNPVLSYQYVETKSTNTQNDNDQTDLNMYENDFMSHYSVTIVKVPMSKLGKQQIHRYWSKYKQTSTSPPETNSSQTHPHSLQPPSPTNLIVNPHPNIVHDKYWAQRHRLFSRFDKGIKLDSEGWYSVTPEVIADHVAKRLGAAVPSIRKASSEPSGGIVILDAFSGMGGNSIAFGKLPSHLVSLVVCVDVDRTKLRMVAHNASLYDIPPEKLLLIESNSLFVMDQCYSNGCRSNPFVQWKRNGVSKEKQHSNFMQMNTGEEEEEEEDGEDFFTIEKAALKIPKRQPSNPTTNCKGYISKPTKESLVRKSSFEVHHPPHQEQYAGYTIGGLDMLPPFIDVIFMDPPWGGIHYGSVGKNGYDLQKNMKINYYADLQTSSTPTTTNTPTPTTTSHKDSVTNNTQKPAVVDGFRLLHMAAKATKSKFVIYDVPKNTNKESLGNAALAAGYRGNMKLEEHYLNGRLKTMTAYLGNDFADLLTSSSSI